MNDTHLEEATLKPCRADPKVAGWDARVSSLAQDVVLATERVHWSHVGLCLGRPHQTRMDFCWPGQIALPGLSQMGWRQHQGSCTLFC